MPNLTNGDSEMKTALQRYQILMSYLQYENSMYWVRANLLLVGNTVLLAAFASVAFSGGPGLMLRGQHPPLQRILASVVLSIVGISLAYQWNRAIAVGDFWRAHWITLLKQIEPAAYGEHLLVRTFQQDTPPSASAKTVARNTQRLFFGLWTAILSYSVASLLLAIRWFVACP
jgi:hypothetical protein